MDDSVREEMNWQGATGDAVPANLEQCWFHMDACAREREELARKQAGIKEKKTRRSIVRKKKNPQTKIKSFFETVTNFQGFPLKHCVYEHSIHDKVYVPPGYGANCFDPRPSFCKECLLKPCITLENMNDEVSIGQRLSDEEMLSNKEVRPRLISMMSEIHKGYYKKNKAYAKQLLPPKCVVESVESYYDSDSNSDNDSDKDDECHECEFVE